MPRWNQHVVEGDEGFPVLVVGESCAEEWARALSFAEYEGHEWTVVPDHPSWIVGYPPGRRHELPSPDFWETVEAPEWIWTE